MTADCRLPVEPGTYRHRGKPVVVWDGEPPHYAVGSQEPRPVTDQFAEETFPFAAADPVPSDWISVWMQTGVWPDEDPAAIEAAHASLEDAARILIEAAKRHLPIDEGDTLACRQAQHVLNALYDVRREAQELANQAKGWTDAFRAQGMRYRGGAKVGEPAEVKAAQQAAPKKGDNRALADQLADVRTAIADLKLVEAHLIEEVAEEMGEATSLEGARVVVTRSTSTTKGSLDTARLAEVVPDLDAYRKPSRETVRYIVKER